MAEVIEVLKTNWDELGSIIEELYGMVHCLNDLLRSEQTALANKEAADIEKEMVKVLDFYNKIESS